MATATSSAWCSKRPPKLLEDPASLSKIYVKGATGNQVPLSNVVKFERSTQPLAINHQGQFPAVTISFGLAPGASLGEASDLIEKALRELNPPSGLRASFQGSAQAFQESFALAEPYGSSSCRWSRSTSFWACCTKA